MPKTTQWFDAGSKQGDIEMVKHWPTYDCPDDDHLTTDCPVFTAAANAAASNDGAGQDSAS